VLAERLLVEYLGNVIHHVQIDAPFGGGGLASSSSFSASPVAAPTLAACWLL
jgi:hypothetical protein